MEITDITYAQALELVKLNIPDEIGNVTGAFGVNDILGTSWGLYGKVQALNYAMKLVYPNQLKKVVKNFGASGYVTMYVLKD